MTESNGTAAPALTFSATYTSPANEPFTHTEPIPAPPTSGVDDRTAYLNSLRKAIGTAQETINRELTARMEEDKAREAGGKNGASAVDDALEEENYGEEAPPNDD
ncbi:Gon7 family protein [Colletotrichum karsti]|uniref:EKC/KEOPS complex subunit GON7 n=1 Tax=Colletotrichum karsti TaxID=1095194 RepID=A0A9P6LJL3_9PEZI|nr:Gon7 family protein [Colletotrichum karsti]KAF9878489.1 Gon7 family protein [Colletotrichum karsti]